MNKLIFPVLAAGMLLGGAALADGGRGHGGHWKHHPHRAAPVVAYYAPYPYYYYGPMVMVQPAPVIIRERIIERPAYDYDYGPPRYEERPARDGRVVGTTLGAIAGAALGSQVGQGNGRIAATAIGAVVGGTLGGR